MFDTTAADSSATFFQNLDPTAQTAFSLALAQVPAAALELAHTQLADFAAEPGFLDTLRIPFGDFDEAQASALFQDLLTGDASRFPRVEVLPADVLPGANGAFDSLTGTIYLADRFLSSNADNPAAIADVLLEEIGHYIDAQINVVDSPGDEGAIFSAIVQGRSLNEAELAALKSKNDIRVIDLNGESSFIENSAKAGQANADVNGDGKADIVGFGDNAVFVALSNGNGTFQQATVSYPSAGFTKGSGGWTNFNDYPRMLADVNGDGKADIVGFGDNAVFVALSNGNGTFQQATVSYPSAGFTKGSGGWTNFNDYPRMLADVNGDGKADIVGFGGNAVFVALSNGNGTFQQAAVSYPSAGFTKGNGGWTNFNDYPRMLADVNGDGKADIVGFGDNAVFVALSNGNGTFQQATVSYPSAGFTKGNGGWTNFNDYPRIFGGSYGGGYSVGLMTTSTNLTQLQNGQLLGQYFDVDNAHGAQCWDLVAYATGISSSSPYWSTSNWKPGPNVMANGNVAVGTAIATFLGPNGSYNNPIYSGGQIVEWRQHTAIFAGYGNESGVSGFYVWEQNPGPARRRFIRNDGFGVNDADNYAVIQV